MQACVKKKTNKLVLVLHPQRFAQNIDLHLHQLWVTSLQLDMLCVFLNVFLFALWQNVSLKCVKWGGKENYIILISF